MHANQDFLKLQEAFFKDFLDTGNNPFKPEPASKLLFEIDAQPHAKVRANMLVGLLKYLPERERSIGAGQLTAIAMQWHDAGEAIRWLAEVPAPYDSDEDRTLVASEIHKRLPDLSKESNHISLLGFVSMLYPDGSTGQAKAMADFFHILARKADDAARIAALRLFVGGFKPRQSLAQGRMRTLSDFCVEVALPLFSRPNDETLEAMRKTVIPFLRDDSPRLQEAIALLDNVLCADKLCSTTSVFQAFAAARSSRLLSDHLGQAAFEKLENQPEIILEGHVPSMPQDETMLLAAAAIKGHPAYYERFAALMAKAARGENGLTCSFSDLKDIYAQTYVKTEDGSFAAEDQTEERAAANKIVLPLMLESAKELKRDIERVWAGEFILRLAEDRSEAQKETLEAQHGFIEALPSPEQRARAYAHTLAACGGKPAPSTLLWEGMTKSLRETRHQLGKDLAIRDCVWSLRFVYGELTETKLKDEVAGRKVFQRPRAAPRGQNLG